MKLKFNHIIIFLFFAFIMQENVFGQNTSITVIDQNSEKGIPFAEIILNKIDGQFLKGLTTDGNGVANFSINQAVDYKVMFLGYTSQSGRINLGEHITIELVEESNLLDDVVVTGQYAPKKADQSIYKIDVVNSKELAERGINNLAEALTNETGLRVTSDATGTKIEMQGMSGENVKYLIDGVPIVGRVGGDIDLSQINMDNVDHIEIVQGPMSVVYGTSAIAGVINIITKKNTTNKNIAKVNAYADSKNTYNFGAYGSIMRGKHTVSASGNRNMFQGIDINMDDDGNIDATDDRVMEFKPKLIYNGELEYAYRNNDFNLRIGSSLMHATLRDYTNLGLDFYYYTLRSISKITVSDRLSKNLSYNVIGAFTYFNRDVETLIQEEVNGKTSTRFDNYMTRGSFTHAKEDSKVSYQFGWDINHEIGTGERVGTGKEDITDYAAFISAQWQILENLSLQPGVRFIYNTAFDAPIIPSINVQWKPINSLNLRASYAKGFRAPTLKELYLNFQDINHNITGNPDLEAETTNSYNASLGYKFKADNFAIKIEPSVFFNDGKDVIALIVTDAGTNAATYANVDFRRTVGGNFNVAFQHNNGLTLSAGYNMTGESIKNGGASWTDTDFYDNITFNAKYNYKKWGLISQANYKFYGETPNLTSDRSTGELYNVYTESYSDLEVTLSKNFYKNRMNLVVGGKNLFDNYTQKTFGNRDFADNYSPINFGRTFFAKVNFRLTN